MPDKVAKTFLMVCIAVFSSFMWAFSATAAPICLAANGEECSTEADQQSGDGGPGGEAGDGGDGGRSGDAAAGDGTGGNAGDGGPGGNGGGNGGAGGGGGAAGGSGPYSGATIGEKPNAALLSSTATAAPDPASVLQVSAAQARYGGGGGGFTTSGTGGGGSGARTICLGCGEGAGDTFDMTNMASWSLQSPEKAPTAPGSNASTSAAASPNSELVLLALGAAAVVAKLSRVSIRLIAPGRRTGGS